MRAIAPGKVILSGEHAVVYGAPALAVAARCHIQAHFQPGPASELKLAGALLESVWPLTDLSDLVTRLDTRFDDFVAGRRAVNRLLDTPDQLIAYVLGQLDCVSGGELTIRSELPAGSGMGSSAAAIAATLLIAEALSNHPLTPDQRFELVRHCERLQHGRGSAIDAAAVTFGGLVRVQNGRAASVNVELGEGWYRVHSGVPSVSTGECVQQVRENFADSEIWQQFHHVTDRLQQALGDSAAVHNAIRLNHQLLAEIGVVPNRIACFIADIEQLGASAKISGAGAIAGEAGGQVLVYAPGVDVNDICRTYNYPCEPLKEDTEGARRISD